MKTSKSIIGVLSGVAVGAAIGILFAPDKGTETRNRIVRKSKDLKNKAMNSIKEGLDSVSETYNSVLSKGEELVKKGKEDIRTEEKDIRAVREQMNK